MYWDKAKTDFVGEGVASGDLAYVPGQPIDVVRFVFVADGSVTGGSQDVELQDAGGGNSETLGSFTLPAMAAGEVAFVNVAKSGIGPTTSSIDGSVVYEGGDVIQVDPGQQINIAFTGGVNAQVYIEYIPQGFTGERVSQATEITYTSA